MSAPEILAPPDPPATPAIDTSTTSTSDSSSSGSSGGASIGPSLTPKQHVGEQPSGGGRSVIDPYQSPEEEAAAALVDLSGAYGVTVEQFESSIPPNLAAASALLDELTASGSVSEAAMGSLYTLMNSGTALALTS